MWVLAELNVKISELLGSDTIASEAEDVVRKESLNNGRPMPGAGAILV